MCLQRLNHFHKWLRVKLGINDFFISLVRCGKLPYRLVLHWKYIACRIQQLDHRAHHLENQSLFSSRLFLKFLLEVQQSRRLLLSIYVETGKDRWFVVRKHVNTHRPVLDLDRILKLALRPKWRHRITDKSRRVRARHFVHGIVCSYWTVVFAERTAKLPVDYFLNGNYELGYWFLQLFVTRSLSLPFSFEKLAL
jgi:hypothetical protein